jgi:hypothetical protein
VKYIRVLGWALAIIGNGILFSVNWKIMLGVNLCLIADLIDKGIRDLDKDIKALK